MMKTSILPQVVRSAAPSVRPSVSFPFFPSGSDAHDFISAPFIFRRFFLPPLFPLSESGPSDRLSYLTSGAKWAP